MGQSGGDGAQRQQFLSLTDDLALPQPADLLPFEQVHRHRELRLHERGERVGVQDEEPRRFGHPHRGLVEVLLAGHICRPRPAVHPALGGPAGFDVHAAGPLRHHHLAVEQYVEAGGRVPPGRSARARRRRCGRSRTASAAGRRSAPRTGTASQFVRRARLAHSSVLPLTPRPDSGAPASRLSTLRRRRLPPVWRIRRARPLQQTHRARLFPGGAVAGRVSSLRRHAGPGRTG